MKLKLIELKLKKKKKDSFYQSRNNHIYL